VYDSFNLADAVRKFRDVSQKPVVALIETSAASGGYLIASQADYIVANQTSVVGSIGVIVNIQDTDGLLEKLGINNIVITSDGAEQKAGKNLSDPNSADYKNTKQLLNDYQLLFNDYVARGRNLTAEQVKRLADGSIVAGKRALDNKLVDELGNMDSAVAQVKVLAGIEGEPRIFNYAQIEVGNNNLFGIINKLFGAKVSNRNVWFASIPY
jgi:protease-4